MSAGVDPNAITRPVLVTALVGGALLVFGAALTLLQERGSTLLHVGAGVFLAAPLVRNLAVIARANDRVPRTLAAVGAVLLLAVYAWVVFTLLKGSP